MLLQRHVAVGKLEKMAKNLILDQFWFALTQTWPLKNYSEIFTSIKCYTLLLDIIVCNFNKN